MTLHALCRKRSSSQPCTKATATSSQYNDVDKDVDA